MVSHLHEVGVVIGHDGVDLPLHGLDAVRTNVAEALAAREARVRDEVAWNESVG